MKCAKKSKTDWTVFAPIRGRVMDLLKDGKSRSAQEVLDAIRAKSNCHVRRVLFELKDEGFLVESFERRARHVVICFRLATPRRLRPVPKTIPAKRG